jgi:hypothetical protein
MDHCPDDVPNPLQHVPSDDEFAGSAFRLVALAGQKLRRRRPTVESQPTVPQRPMIWDWG